MIDSIFVRRYASLEPTISISTELQAQKIPHLILTKSASSSTVQAGETITVSIRIENTGSADAKAVEMADTISALRLENPVK